jgi:hypothetical protein
VGFTPWAVSAVGWTLVASTFPTAGLGGVALINGTPTLVSWTAPSDGQQHRAFIVVSMNVTTLEVGGGINWTYTDPAGVTQAAINVIGGGQAVGGHKGSDAAIVGPGTAVTMQQTALTGGAATVWCEIWAS